MTLMKLRLNLSNYDLGFRFCVHDTTVSRIIIKWVQILDVRLSPLIYWPEREQLQKNNAMVLQISLWSNSNIYH